MLVDRATPAMRDRFALQVDHLALADLARRQKRRPVSTTAGKRRYAKRRRAGLREKNLCINGAAHGTATSGVLCESCRAAHKRSS